MGEMLADATVDILAGTSIAGLTSRAIAAWLRVTPSALTQRADRAEVIRLVLIFFADRWEKWVHIPPWHDLPARLPMTEEEVHGVRVWHALGELARGEALAGNLVPTDVIGRAREEERASVSANLARLLDRRPTDAEVVGTVALVAGLRLELATAPTAISATEAADVLTAHVRRLRADT